MIGSPKKYEKSPFFKVEYEVCNLCEKYGTYTENMRSGNPKFKPVRPINAKMGKAMSNII